jgi:hypothetical protein
MRSHPSYPRRGLTCGVIRIGSNIRSALRKIRFVAKPAGAVHDHEQNHGSFDYGDIEISGCHFWTVVSRLVSLSKS